MTDSWVSCPKMMGWGRLRHQLTNSPDCLIAAPQSAANLSITQLWMLGEGLSDPLEPKVLNQLLHRAALYSLSQLFPGRDRLNTVHLAPKGKAGTGAILDDPLPCLWVAFLGVHQSTNQYR